MDAQDYRELVRQIAYEQARVSSSSFFFTGEDALRIVSFNSLAGVVLTLEGRFLTAAGIIVPFQESHTPNSDRSIAASLHRLGEGFLLNARIRASTGAPRRGQCFVMLDVVRGSGATIIPLATLITGYCEDTTPEAWPGAALIDSVEGPGIVRSIAGTDPAAGAECADTVPTNSRWRLISWFAQLVTDATVTNRTVSLITDDGANTLSSVTAPAAQTATQTRQYSAYPGGGAPRLDGTVFYLPIAPTLTLMQGFRVRTATAGIVAGDNWGAPQLLVEEWIED